MSEPQRILVIETLYLGDLVHTLPLLQALRLRYPQARLDVLVRGGHVALMGCVDGVDRVLAYEPSQHRGLSGIWALCRSLRAERYDLVLNPGASDRATIFTWLSGGGQRIGRLNRNQSKLLWWLLHDQVIDEPWGVAPMFLQKLHAFAGVMHLPDTVRFGLTPPTLDRAALGLPMHYIHLSPMASEEIRCLPPALVIDLLRGLRARYPHLGLVVSAGPSERERGRLEQIRNEAAVDGVVYLAGRCSLPELCAVIGSASLHIGPDSGPLHLARALDTPAVGCFLYKPTSAEWMPVGDRYRTVGVPLSAPGGLHSLKLEDVLEAVDALMSPGC